MNELAVNADVEKYMYYQIVRDTSLAYLPATEVFNQISKVDNGEIPNICNIYIFNRNNCYNIYLKDNFQNIDSKLFPDSWYKAIANQPNTSLLLGTNLRKYSNGSERYVVSYTKFLENAGYYYSDVILVDYDLRSLIQYIYNDTSVKQLKYLDSYFYIVDSKNNIMYNLNDKLLTTKLDYSFNGNLQNQSSGSFTVTMNHVKYYLIYYTSPYNRWKYISFIPMSKVNGAMAIDNVFYSILIFLLFILVFIFAYISSSIILKPINKLVKSMSEIKKGNYSTRIIVKRRDETRILAESFN